MIGDFKPELLAPCGDWDAFVAAVENGADAVYMGGKLFNARQFASNFDEENFKEAVQYAHARDVNVYRTMNTLIGDSEIKEALKALEQSYLAGIDGVIVQDIGLAGLIKNLFPDLPLHASTQMTIYNLEGVRQMEELGFKRVVLARELSLEEIEHIAKSTSLEIEVFVHGALCVCYSGQCLMSSIIGGRSGNRGKCAQPCRLPYRLLESGKEKTLSGKKTDRGYFLSPKDLCSIEILDKLVKAGVKSLKIEGRMKSPEYVATVVRVYRKYLDRLLEEPGSYGADIEEKDIKDLTQIFNRGDFSKGYLEGKTGRDMMSFEKPKNWGIYLGEVISYDKASESVKIKLEEPLSIGDGIEVWNNEDESPGTIVTSIRVNGKTVTEANPQQVAEVRSIKGKIGKGNRVYKTSDKKLNTFAKESFTGKSKRKIPIEGRLSITSGKPVSIIVKDYAGNEVEVKSQYIPEKALTSPITEERVVRQAAKTGQTPFEFKVLSADVGEGLSVPISEINTLRRSALEELEAKRSDRYPHRKPGNLQEKSEDMLHFPGNSRNGEKDLKISACFYTDIDGLEYENLGADRIYLPFGMLLGKKKERILRLKENAELFVFIPPITRGNYDELIKSRLEDIVEMGFDGILLGNPGAVQYAKAYGELCVMGDYSLNVFNSFSVKALMDMGFDGATISLELNLNQIKALEKFPEFTQEVLVYGRIPLMTSEYCPVGSIKGNFGKNSKCNMACKDKNFYLEDRMNMKFPVLCDRIDCRSTIFNAKVLLLSDTVDRIKTSGVDMIRLNFTDESPNEVRDIIRMHSDILNEGSKALDSYKELIDKIKDRGFTKGHFPRGV
ncbi:MAG TPA: DUF3656 domain-containing protein [Acetivibrio sp.]|uniref:DUF3656 domain-containing U32 family peptidase n=1 Tax=Acetivibrio sp. TaxID=1872092 RepID=UPI002C16B484|nr:DUF3656 domain-containing protein [Acetivibrio sp.]HOM02885.1 DUF3656 domain-containing protein [Acetivibrio sp.]